MLRAVRLFKFQLFNLLFWLGIIPLYYSSLVKINTRRKIFGFEYIDRSIFLNFQCVYFGSVIWVLANTTTLQTMFFSANIELRVPSWASLASVTLGVWSKKFLSRCIQCGCCLSTKFFIRTRKIVRYFFFRRFLMLFFLLMKDLGQNLLFERFKALVALRVSIFNTSLAQGMSLRRPILLTNCHNLQ